MILYAIPAPLGGAAADALAPSALRTVASLKDFVVEEPKTARAFLGEIGMAVRELNIVQIGADIPPLLQPLREGRPLGLLSEAGCPAIADPGAKLVDAAHREGFRVVPLVGPSSIVLALMASGLEGQRFAFCGYLPREPLKRKMRIKELEARSLREQETAIFIETPYRNEAMLEALLSTCASTTMLCVAADLTLPTETISVKTIAEWRRAAEPVGRRPAVFLLLANGAR
ncbi:MAG TPA: SAM-dependent methyltransferase [Burkholderiales bacterium]